MTDNEIIKALECCIHSCCVGCPCADDDANSCNYDKKYVLDLINRQKAEIEELRSDKIIAETHERNVRNLFTDCVKQLEEARAEIKELKDILEKVPTNAYDLQVEASEKLENQIKSEAIKEFADRVKRKRIALTSEEPVYDLFKVGAIDNLVKEMTEGWE